MAVLHRGVALMLAALLGVISADLSLVQDRGLFTAPSSEFVVSHGCIQGAAAAAVYCVIVGWCVPLMRR